MIGWYALAALAVGLIYWRQGFGAVAMVTGFAFIAGLAGAAVGGWL